MIRVRCIKNNWAPNLTIGKIYYVIASASIGSAGNLYFLMDDSGDLHSYSSRCFEIVNENEYEVQLL